MSNFEGIPQAIYSDINAMLSEELAVAEAKKQTIDDIVFEAPDADIETLKHELEIQYALVQGIAKAFQVAYEFRSGERTVD